MKNMTKTRMTTPVVVLSLLLLVPLTADAGDPGDSPALEAGSSANPGTMPQEPYKNTEEGLDRGAQQVRLAGSTLRPRNSDVVWQSSGGGGCIYAPSGSTSTWWNLPLTLPQGAEVTGFRMYFNDTATSDSYSYFTIYDLFGNVIDEWGTASFGDTGTGFSNATFSHVIDYDVYSYVMNWRPGALGSAQQLCGFRIYYVFP